MDVGVREAGRDETAAGVEFRDAAGKNGPHVVDRADGRDQTVHDGNGVALEHPPGRPGCRSVDEERAHRTSLPCMPGRPG
jgi:hypothetical protein